MMDQCKIKILVTGDFRHYEFADAFPANEHYSISFAEWPPVPADLPDHIDFVFIAQSRRGQFSQRDIDALIATYPLAQRAIVFGAWCEGETRSGQPLQGIHRIYLREWTGIFRVLLNDFSSTGYTQLSHPVTESRSDLLYARESISSSTSPLNIAVQSTSPDCFHTIKEFCVARGWTAIRFDNCTKCDLLIVECYKSIDEAIGIGPSFHSTRGFGVVPVVVICGFPRHQDRAVLQEHFGAFELIGKPFDNRVLEEAVQQLACNGQLKIVTDVA